MWKNMKLWLKNHDYAWKYKLEVCLPLFVFLVLCDWIPKWVIQAKGLLYTGSSHGLMSFDPIINMGAARGIMDNQFALTVTLASIITFVVLIATIFVNDKMWLIGIIFVFAGSFANLIARAWAPANPQGLYGGAIDFIYVNFDWLHKDWSYVNNMADNWVVIGIILFIAFVIVEIVKTVKSEKAEKKNKNENKSK